MHRLALTIFLKFLNMNHARKFLKNFMLSHVFPSSFVRRALFTYIICRGDVCTPPPLESQFETWTSGSP